MPLFDESLLELPLYEDRHRRLAADLQRWIEEQAAVPAQIDRLTPSERGRHYTRLLGRHGWLRFATGDPEKPGGRPDLRSLCLIRQALAYFDDLADFAFAIHGLASAPILWWGSAQQRAEWGPGLERGEWAGSLALSEPKTGSNLAALDLAATLTAPSGTRDTPGYRITGEKTWVSNADIADFHCVLARTSEGPGSLGLSMLLVPADTPRLTVSAPIPLLAPRSFASLQFDDCSLPADACIGEPGMGYRYAMEILDFYRVSVAAAAVGFCQRATDRTLDWVGKRQAFGTALADHQFTKGKLANMAVYLDAASLLTARAAWDFDVGRGGDSRHASIAKLFATEEAQHVIDDALQLFGAAGLVTDSVTEQLYRQIRSLRIYEGTSEIQQLIIAGTMLRAASRSRQMTTPR